MDFPTDMGGMGQEKSEHSNEISGVQSKMARVALRLGVRELAKKSGVSPDTVSRLERGEDLKPSTITAIRSALEAAGVEFIEENGGGAGVRLSKGEAGQRQT